MEFDLHIHSKFSIDCNMRPDKIVNVARAKGLDGIAITDHNEVQGALETLKFAKDNLMVIIGEEIMTRSGEIIGLFLKEKILPGDPIEVINEIHSQNGIAILAHPFVMQLSIDEKIARMLDGCEGFNSRHARTRLLNDTNGEKLIVDFAREYNLSLTAGSDAHFYNEIGRAHTVIPASNLDEVKDTILRGNTVLVGRRTSGLRLMLSAIIRESKRLFNPIPNRYDK